MCRKLETEEEKVLPFGTVPPTPRSAEEDEKLVKESKTKLNNVVSDYEVRAELDGGMMKPLFCSSSTVSGVASTRPS